MATLLPSTTGQIDLRKEHISKIVDGFALAEYRFKEACMIQPTSAWEESYFQEEKTELSGGTGAAFKGVPRKTGFPRAGPEWTKKESYVEKFGAEDTLSWEDKNFNNIDVVARTLLRIAKGVTKAVDDAIWAVISNSQSSATLINGVTIATGYEWDSATESNRNPLQDVLNAIKEISIDNYNALSGNGILYLSPTDFANFLGNANVKNSGQFYTDTVTKNGVVGRVCGLTVRVSNSVTNNYALVVVAKVCATWKAAHPLTTVTIVNPGISTTVRTWEAGVCQLTNPEAVCLITNTQK